MQQMALLQTWNFKVPKFWNVFTCIAGKSKMKIEYISSIALKVDYFSDACVTLAAAIEWI